MPLSEDASLVERPAPRMIKRTPAALFAGIMLLAMVSALGYVLPSAVRSTVTSTAPRGAIPSVNMAEPFAKLVLLRHGQSVWNEASLFTGWADVELTTLGAPLDIVALTSSIVHKLHVLSRRQK